jgi:hypothetical protein
MGYRDRTSGSVVWPPCAAHDRPMKKRILAAFLWFYSGWYAGALLADFIGISPLLGPFIGATAALLVVGDPRQIIWKARSVRPAAAEATPEPV